jgi:riboflavin synthase
MGAHLTTVAHQMFTGIIADLGTVRSFERSGASRDARLTIATGFDTTTIAIGASIACSGCCLTVVEKSIDTLAFDVSSETIARTALGEWRDGRRVNLERALRLGEELGGHLVSGHVDGLAALHRRTAKAGSVELEFALDRALGRFLASKGSVALDGVSLTVNSVVDDSDGRTRFTINMIPYTGAVTTLGSLALSERVHVEVDMLARYVARLREPS